MLHSDIFSEMESNTEFCPHPSHRSDHTSNCAHHQHNCSLKEDREDFSEVLTSTPVPDRKKMDDKTTTTEKYESLSNQPSEAVTREICTLANACLHASYTFFVIAQTFANEKLPSLAGKCQDQEKRHWENSRKLWSHLVLRGAQIALGDIAKPTERSYKNSWEALKIWEGLEGWVADQMREVKKKSEGDVIQDILKNMLEDQLVKA